MLNPAALTVAAAGFNMSAVLTVGATVLVALLAAGSAAGGFAAFRTGRTNAIAASAVARADEAEATANTWKGRVEATQSEFTAHQKQAAHDLAQAREAQAISEHEIAKLKLQVATLEGVVTARHELAELVTVVSGISQTVGSMLGQITADHTTQHADHALLLAALGGRRTDDH